VPDKCCPLPQGGAGRYLPRSCILFLLAIFFRSCFGAHAVDAPYASHRPCGPLASRLGSAASVFSGRSLSERSTPTPLRRGTPEASPPGSAPFRPLPRRASPPVCVPLHVRFVFPILPRCTAARAFSRYSRTMHVCAPSPRALLCRLLWLSTAFARMGTVSLTFRHSLGRSRRRRERR